MATIYHTDISIKYLDLYLNISNNNWNTLNINEW